MLFMDSGLTPSGTCFSKDSLLGLNGFLRTEHRLAAGDMTSMLYYALKGFRFEMIDEMIFNRTFASTAVEGRKLQDTLDSVDEAFEHFFKEVTDHDIEKLLRVSVRLKHTPLLLYFAISKNPLYREKVAKMLWKEVVKHPMLLRKKMLYKTFKRVYA